MDGEARSYLPRMRRGTFLRCGGSTGARKWLISFGGLPNLYADFDDAPSEKNGRLYGIGEFNVQRFPRRARALLLSVTDWWDYDLAAAHPTISVELARAYHVPTPTLDDFLANRAERQVELAEECDLPPKTMKRIMTAVLFGQRLSTHPSSSLRKQIGKEGVRRLQQSVYYHAIREELRDARGVIVQRSTIDGRIVNAVGKVALVVDDAGKKVQSTHTLLSHILTGIEQLMVNAACEGESGLVALIHDGWISMGQMDVKKAEARMQAEAREKLNLNLRMHIKAEQFGH